MDGHIAPLPDICSLAKKYNALVFVDDCHSTGFMGPRGRGTDEYWGLMGQVDIINTTLGKVTPPGVLLITSLRLHTLGRGCINVRLFCMCLSLLSAFLQCVVRGWELLGPLWNGYYFLVSAS